MTYLTIDQSTQDAEPVGLLTFSRGTTEWYYTTDPADYEFESEIYQAVAGGFDLPDIEATREAVRNRVKIDVSRENPIALLFHRASPTDAIGIIWREVMRGDTDVVVRWVGRVSGCSWDARGRATLECVSVEDDSNEPNGLKFAISLTCQADLFDDYCGLDRTDWDHATTVVSVDGATIEIDSAGFANSNDYLPYDGGEIVFTDANGNLDRRMIESIDTSGANPVVTLFRPFTDLIASDAVTLYPSCDHTIETCQSVYGNKLNCRCRPHLSTKNPMNGQGIF